MIKIANIMLDNDEDSVIEVYKISKGEDAVLDVLTWDAFSKIHDKEFNCCRIEMITEDILRARNIESLLKDGSCVGMFIDYEVNTDEGYEKLVGVKLIRYALNEKCLQAVENGTEWIETLDKAGKLDWREI